MASGTILVFDLEYLVFTTYSIDNLKNQSPISDIKCQPEKMHRLLYAMENSGVAVYSLNKQAKTQEVEFTSDDLTHRGRVLACEWIYH